MNKIVKVVVLGLAFFGAVCVGDLINSKVNQPTVTLKEDTYQQDNLPLENGGEILIHKQYGEVVVIFKQQDLEYVVNSRRRTKNTFEKIEQLIDRFEYES